MSSGAKKNDDRRIVFDEREDGPAIWMYCCAPGEFPEKYKAAEERRRSAKEAAAARKEAQRRELQDEDFDD